MTKRKESPLAVFANQPDQPRATWKDWLKMIFLVGLIGSLFS